MDRKKLFLFVLFLSFATLIPVVVCIESFCFDNIGQFLSDSHSFISRFISNPSQIGSILPSSDSLAKEITRYIANARFNRKKILEVGAGTGVFTGQIVKCLSKNDVLDVVEIDDELCNLLREKFGNNENVRIHNISILDLNVTGNYDYIVSGLPFNAFDSSFVKAVLYKYKKIIKQGGVISYFEYAAIPSISKFIMSALFMFERKKRYLSVLDETKSFRDSCAQQYEREIVLQNIPPAYVYFLKI